VKWKSDFYKVKKQYTNLQITSLIPKMRDKIVIKMA